MAMLGAREWVSAMWVFPTLDCGRGGTYRDRRLNTSVRIEVCSCPGRGAALLQRCTAEPGPTAAVDPGCSASRHEGWRAALHPGTRQAPRRNSSADRADLEYLSVVTGLAGN